MRTEIKAANGKIRGYVIEFGGRKTLQTTTGKVLGWYTESMDSTFNASGSLLGRGNQLTFLLPSEKKN